MSRVRLAGEPWGFVFAFLNYALFMLYVMLGHKIAAQGGAAGIDRPGAAMLMAAACVAPIGFSQARAAFSDWRLLGAAVGVGVCSSVIPYVCDQLAMARHAIALRPASQPAKARREAFVQIGMERGHMRDLKRFRQTLTELPEVLECHSMTGDVDYILKVITQDLSALSAFLTERLALLPGVNLVRSSVCLDELKSHAALPLALSPAAG